MVSLGDEFLRMNNSTFKVFFENQCLFLITDKKKNSFWDLLFRLTNNKTTGSKFFSLELKHDFDFVCTICIFYFKNHKMVATGKGRK